MTDMKNQIAAWKAQTEYACEYTHHGQKWATSFFAINDADAALKLESIKKSLVIIGVIDTIIHVDE